MNCTELHERRQYAVVHYARHESEEGVDYEFLSWRGVLLDHANYERKLYRELAHALDDSATIDHDGIEVVAYLKADDATSFEGSSYAVIAIEQTPGRGATFWVGDEIAEELQLW